MRVVLGIYVYISLFEELAVLMGQLPACVLVQIAEVLAAGKPER